MKKTITSEKEISIQENEEEKPEPKKELSMAEQLAKVTLKKVPDALTIV